MPESKLTTMQIGSSLSMAGIDFQADANSFVLPRVTCTSGLGMVLRSPLPPIEIIGATAVVLVESPQSAGDLVNQFGRTPNQADDGTVIPASVTSSVGAEQRAGDPTHIDFSSDTSVAGVPVEVIGDPIEGLRTAIHTDGIQRAASSRLPLVRLVRNERLPDFSMAIRRSDARSFLRDTLFAADSLEVGEVPQPMFSIWGATDDVQSNSNVSSASGRDTAVESADRKTLISRILEGLGDPLPEQTLSIGGLSDATCSVAAYGSTTIDMGPCMLSNATTCGMRVQVQSRDQIQISGSTTVVAEPDGVCHFTRLQIIPTNAQLLGAMTWVFRSSLRG